MNGEGGQRRCGHSGSFIPAGGTCLLLAAVLILCPGCGGGGGTNGGTSNGTGEPSAQSGILLDSPVGGVQYQTTTAAGAVDTQGTTDPDGRYFYHDGDTVTFSLGDITLGQATALPTVTLVDLVPTALDATDPTVINLATFLQTFDSDQNPANGIDISPAVSQAAVGKSIDFNVSQAAFAAEPDLQQMLQETGATLVDPATAEQTLVLTLQGLTPVALQSGEYFTGQPKYVWQQAADGSWQTVLAPNQNGLPYYLTIMRRPTGLSAIIDQKLTYLDTGYPAQLSKDNTSVVFDAASTFPKVAQSGDASLWDWQCRIVEEQTSLQGYMPYEGGIVPYTLDQNGDQIPDPSNALTCTMSVVDRDNVKITWGIDADTAVAAYNDMLAIDFSATYK